MNYFIALAEVIIARSHKKKYYLKEVLLGIPRAVDVGVIPRHFSHNFVDKLLNIDLIAWGVESPPSVHRNKPNILRVVRHPQLVQNIVNLIVGEAKIERNGQISQRGIHFTLHIHVLEGHGDHLKIYT